VICSVICVGRLPVSPLSYSHSNSSVTFVMPMPVLKVIWFDTSRAAILQLVSLTVNNAMKVSNGTLNWCDIASDSTAIYSDVLEQYNEDQEANFDC